MKVLPLAFDSMGVRSEAAFIETKDVKALVDPGAALGPKRYSLPPHRLEYDKLAELTDVIRGYARRSDVLVITHYHYDHYTPSDPALYENKILLIKHPTEKINHSQKKRASLFLKEVEDAAREIRYADGEEFNFGATRIGFSSPVYHGDVGTRLGFVIMMSISDGKEKFLHGSDAQGPIDDNARDWIIKENPDIAVVDGSITYMLGFRLSWKNFLHGLENLATILRESDRLKKVVYDHHLVRDLHYKEKLSKNHEISNEIGKKIVTAMEFLGGKNSFLEANRKKLYEELPE